MNDLRRTFQEIGGVGWIALGLGAAAAGALLIYGGMPERETVPATQEIAQASVPPPVPEAPPPPPRQPTEEERQARAAALAAKANIDVLQAWTRATADSATSAPVYLQIISNKDPDRLVGVDVAAATGVELRESAGPNGATRAAASPELDIPPGGTLAFEPGSRHFLLTGLKAPLKEGDSFLLTFKFDKAGTESAVVRILGPNANGFPPVEGRRGDTTQSVTTQ